MLGAVRVLNVERRTKHFNRSTVLHMGTAVAQWLRCCAKSRKVAGSIPASVS